MNDEIKEFIRNNIEIVIDYDDIDSSRNEQYVGLRFKGEDQCFTRSDIYIPLDAIDKRLEIENPFLAISSNEIH